MEMILKQLQELCESAPNVVAMLSNASALLNEYLDNINWVGFYLYEDNKLVLGPFQGKVACNSIEIGKGVCGTAFNNKQVLNIEDVHKFKGHIACDSASNSEIVIPLHVDNEYFGVLDIDSPIFNRFTTEHQEILTKAADIIAKYL